MTPSQVRREKLEAITEYVVATVVSGGALNHRCPRCKNRRYRALVRHLLRTLGTVVG